MSETERLYQSARENLLQKNFKAFERDKNLLLGKATMALANQNNELLRLLSSRLSTLAVLADHYAAAAEPGDAFRLLADLLSACSITSKPMERLHLAKPNILTGKMLRLIQAEPGITPKDIATRMGLRPNHVSNLLRKLIDGHVVDRQSNGRNLFFNLSESGHEAIEFFDNTSEQRVAQVEVNANNEQPCDPPPLHEETITSNTPWPDNTGWKPNTRTPKLYIYPNSTSHSPVSFLS